MPEIGQLTSVLRSLNDYINHCTLIFPEDTDDSITVTAGALANAFGEWAEIQDDKGSKLSAKFDEKPGYITAVVLEDCSVKDKRYLLEISYCALHVLVARSRFMKLETKINVSHFAMIRSCRIPAGMEVYYRLKCETGGETAELQLRYYNV